MRRKIKSWRIIIIKNTNCPPCSHYHPLSPTAMHTAYNSGFTVTKWLPHEKNTCSLWIYHIPFITIVPKGNLLWATCKTVCFFSNGMCYRGCLTNKQLPLNYLYLDCSLCGFSLTNFKSQAGFLLSLPYNVGSYFSPPTHILGCVFWKWKPIYYYPKQN